MIEPPANNDLDLLPDRLNNLVGVNFTKKVNCFCVAKNFFAEGEWKSLSADEVLDFASGAFQQVGTPVFPCLGLIWSRTSDGLPLG